AQVRREADPRARIDGVVPGQFLEAFLVKARRLLRSVEREIRAAKRDEHVGLSERLHRRSLDRPLEVIDCLAVTTCARGSEAERDLGTCGGLLVADASSLLEDLAE